jgi:cytochrome c
MGKLLKAGAMALILCFGVTAAVHAEERGSRDEAKAMSESAAHFLTANGKDKAFAAFDDGTSGFKNKDLYVFAYDPTGICLAHGLNKALIGKNLIGLKDVDGKALIAEIVAVQSSGWVDYKWKNPQSGAVELKHAYIVRAGDVAVGVGAYDQQ